VTVELVTDATFEERAVKAPVLTVVDFFTAWCGPCKLLSPTLDELSEDYGATVRFVKVDAEESPEVARRYDVTGYPTVVMLSEGEEVGRFSGAWPRREVRRRIDGCLGKEAPGPTGAQVTLPPVAPDVERLLRALEGLGPETWKALNDSLEEAAALSAAEPAPMSDQDQLSVLVSAVSNDVADLAAARLADEGVVEAVITSAVPAFVGWLGVTPLNHGQVVAAAPVARHLHIELPADRAEAPAAFVAALTALSEEQWSQVVDEVARGTVARDAVQELGGKDREHMLAHWRAWFAAATLAKVLATRDVVDPALYEAAWAPFAATLDRALVEHGDAA